MIHEEIVTYEVAKLAKEKGFDVPTDRYYHIYDDVIEAQNSLEMTGDGCADFYNSLNQCRCSAPTQSLLQRWLREEKGIQICIDSDLNFDDETFVYEWQITNKENFNNGGFEIHRYNSEESHCTYELALEDALKYALENLV